MKEIRRSHVLPGKWTHHFLCRIQTICRYSICCSLQWKMPGLDSFRFSGPIHFQDDKSLVACQPGVHRVTSLLAIHVRLSGSLFHVRALQWLLSHKENSLQFYQGKKTLPLYLDCRVCSISLIVFCRILYISILCRRDIFALCTTPQCRMSISYSYLSVFSSRDGICLTTLAGLPTATVHAGISFVTNDPAPTMAPSPIVTPGIIIVPVPVEHPRHK